ncbi:MAG: GFA family protein, partial [Limibaculum sp.]
MSETVFEGGCLCGAVRYRATARPLRCVICHCADCRKHSG